MYFYTGMLFTNAIYVLHDMFFYQNKLITKSSLDNCLAINGLLKLHPPPFQHHHVTPFPSSSDIGFYKFFISMPLIPILHPM